LFPFGNKKDKKRKRRKDLLSFREHLPSLNRNQNRLLRLKTVYAPFAPDICLNETCGKTADSTGLFCTRLLFKLPVRTIYLKMDMR
jgi:hypothetical protein